MSLWTIPLSQISFKDVEDFCALGLPEGTNVDYKADVPAKLDKIVSSLANTTGGLAILGVKTDAKNRPNAIVGLPNVRGFSERITEICRERIHPPILPEISPLIELPTDSTRAVAVLRMDQSRFAPHAIKNRTKVYIRRGDITDVIDLADIDRIAWMLNQRKELESIGQSFVNQNLERMDRFMQSNYRGNPAAWWCVAPLYPWQNVCKPDECRRAAFNVSLHRAPNGAFGLASRHGALSTIVAVEAKGCVFRGEVLLGPFGDDKHRLDLRRIFSLSDDFFSSVRRFYQNSLITHPGTLKLSLGFVNVQFEVVMGTANDLSESKFPDTEFTAKEICSYETFVDSGSGLMPELERLYNAVAHAFNSPPMY